MQDCARLAEEFDADAVAVTYGDAHDSGTGGRIGPAGPVAKPLGHVDKLAPTKCQHFDLADDVEPEPLPEHNLVAAAGIDDRPSDGLTLDLQRNGQKGRFRLVEKVTTAGSHE